MEGGVAEVCGDSIVPNKQACEIHSILESMESVPSVLGGVGYTPVRNGKEEVAANERFQKNSCSSPLFHHDRHRCH